MSPVLRTLAKIVRLVPVSREWITCGAYSVESRSISSGSPALSASLVATYSARFSSLMRT